MKIPCKRIAARALLITGLLLLQGLPAISQSIADMVADVKPSVVLVFARLPDRISTGSGFVVHSSGYILTARHIFDQGGNPGILLPGGSEVNASLVAIDQNLDLAILRIGRSGLRALRLGSSGTLRQGEEILVMGYPRVDALGAYDSSVTRGIISSLTTRFGWIQIDAAVNPGNSGGPVLNLKGEVVGVALAGLREAVGINFAAPIDRARPFITSHIPSIVVQPTPSPPPSPPSQPSPTLPSQPPMGVRSTLVIPGVGLGTVSLGSEIQEAYGILGAGGRKITYPNVLRGSFMSTRYGSDGVALHRWFLTQFVSELFDPHIFVVETSSGKIGAVGVQGGGPSFLAARENARDYRMAEGVGVGNTEAEIRQKLGPPTTIVEQGGVEASRTLIYANLGIRFRVLMSDYAYIWRDWKGTVFDLSVFFASQR